MRKLNRPTLVQKDFKEKKFSKIKCCEPLGLPWTMSTLLSGVTISSMVVDRKMSTDLSTKWKKGMLGSCFFSNRQLIQALAAWFWNFVGNWPSQLKVSSKNKESEPSNKNQNASTKANKNRWLWQMRVRASPNLHVFMHFDPDCSHSCLHSWYCSSMVSLLQCNMHHSVIEEQYPRHLCGSRLGSAISHQP